MHIVLAGDSIFDNAAYVKGGPDVITQLRDRLPQNARATLLAIDGNTTHGIEEQLTRLPEDATHIVVSIGGNNALMQSSELGKAAKNVGEAMFVMASIRQAFEQEYETMLESVLSHGLPAILCTIYNPRFDDPVFNQVASIGVVLFNDVILQAAFRAGIAVLDLRQICDDDDDFANPIEPSARGGAKIAAAIERAVSEHDFTLKQTRVFV
jgi:hypothetical protein